jgi:hypothetical protein
MTILINSVSTTFGPPGQWIYINGEGFVIDGTTVLLNDQSVENLLIYNEKLIGFSVPIDMSDGFKSIKIQTNDEQYTEDTFFEVGTVTQSPTIQSIIADDKDTWIFVTGENFSWDQTSVTFNDTTTKCFVYSPFSCGFKKNVDELVTSLILTTPNGSVTYSI